MVATLVPNILYFLPFSFFTVYSFLQFQFLQRSPDHMKGLCDFTVLALDCTELLWD